MRLLLKLVGWAIAIPAIVLLIVAGVTSIPSGTEQSAQPVVVEVDAVLDLSEFPAEQREKVSAAASTLFKGCSGLAQYRQDIEWISADRNMVEDYLAEEHGWTDWVSVTLKISNSARTPKDWAAWGHTLYFAVNGNSIWVNKATGGHFCGLGERSGFIEI